MSSATSGRSTFAHTATTLSLGIWSDSEFSLIVSYPAVNGELFLIFELSKVNSYELVSIRVRPQNRNCKIDFLKEQYQFI